jgi:hypothetical protein
MMWKLQYWAVTIAFFQGVSVSPEYTADEAEWEKL